MPDFSERVFSDLLVVFFKKMITPGQLAAPKSFPEINFGGRSGRAKRRRLES